jgi:hypothetical protein
VSQRIEIDIDSVLESLATRAVPGLDRRRARLADGIGDRSEAEVAPGIFLRLDRFGDAACAFLRCASQTTNVTLQLRGHFWFAQVPAGGWLAYPLDGADSAYWFPLAPRQRRLNPQQHILSEEAKEFGSLLVDEHGVSATLDVQHGCVVDLVCWRLAPDAANGLRELSVLESQPYFLWGSHTAFRRPADLYRHMIFGSIYEDRYAWPFKRRICSENDAHALYVLLGGLRAATGKPVLGLLLRQIILSVLFRQTPEGAFRHGEWSQDLETHFRLHCSGMHLMMDSLRDFPSKETERCLALAAAFLQTAKSRIDAGTWFLHDELELSEAAMKRGPFPWVRSRALGKSPTNMLVLNTHLDATIALHRYAEVTGDNQYADAVESATRSTRMLLALRPLEWLYRLVFWPIRLTLMPAEEQARLTLPKRIAKRIGWKYLAPNLHRLKARFPRLVMPGGYIDRALPLASWSFHYLSVNLMDLVRHQRRLPSAEIKSAIDGALRFTHESGVLARWAELNYERYAIGFWAEALYHVCTLFPDLQYRAWLAEAMLTLEDLRMGQPPSLLGTNAEAIPVALQFPCPSPADAWLRVANLGRQGAPEFLVLNTTHEPVAINWDSPPPADLRWRHANGSELVRESPLAPRSWVLAGLGH